MQGSTLLESTVVSDVFKTLREQKKAAAANTPAGAPEGKSDGKHLRKFQPERALIDRGVGCSAKLEVIERKPANPLHIAAGSQYNRVAEKWERLEELLTELEAKCQAVHPTLYDETLEAAIEERALPLEWTPLQYACRTGSAADVQRLLDLGASVATRDVHGSTPLHQAARSDVEPVDKIKALFAAGANLDAPDRQGMRPLHVAASCEKHKAAGELVLLGCKSVAKDCPLLDGDKPWDVARRVGADKVCVVMAKNARRSLKLSGGETQLIHADSIFLRQGVPAPFAPKRMSVKPPTWEE